MNHLKNIAQNVKDNAVDYYTTLLIAVGIPVVIGLLVNYKIALLVSFISQVILGLIYIRTTK